MAKQQPEPKQYDLKNIEVAHINAIRKSSERVLTSYLITVATERLGYTVTPNTQFQIGSNTNSLLIVELPEPEEPKKDVEVQKAG